MFVIEYLKVVLKHKWEVFKAAKDLGIPVEGMLHDLSKFLPDEFWPYAVHFKGGPWVKSVWTWLTGNTPKESFDTACAKHYSRNKHHWQQWVKKYGEHEVIVPMPYRYLVEMLADWIGASSSYNSTALEWYKKKGHELKLKEEQRKWLEEQIGYRV